MTRGRGGGGVPPVQKGIRSRGYFRTACFEMQEEDSLTNVTSQEDPRGTSECDASVRVAERRNRFTDC